MDKMPVLVTGHSFVRRLGSELTACGNTLSTDSVAVTLEGQGGAFIMGARSFRDRVLLAYSKQHYPLVIYELGSNDIQGSRDIDKVVESYVSEVVSLCTRFRAHAVLCLPIPRMETMFPHSVSRTAKFNDLLKIKVADIPNIALWKHKGLHRPSWRYMARDGVHLNGDGNIKYFFSLKCAINMYSGKLKGGSFK